MYYLEIDPAWKAHSLPQALGNQKKKKKQEDKGKNKIWLIVILSPLPLWPEH